MTRIAVCCFVVVAAGCATLSPAAAMPTSCKAARQELSTSAIETKRVAADYTACISSRSGSDDCSEEFVKLAHAQARFAASMSGFSTQCGQ